MSITLQLELNNESWDTMDLEVTEKEITIECPELGKVTMSHEEFDNISYQIKKFREACAEKLDIEIT